MDSSTEGEVATRSIVKGRKRKKRIQQIHEASKGVLIRRISKELEEDLYQANKTLMTLRKDKNIVKNSNTNCTYILILVEVNSS